MYCVDCVKVQKRPKTVSRAGTPVEMVPAGKGVDNAFENSLSPESISGARLGRALISAPAAMVV